MTTTPHSTDPVSNDQPHPQPTEQTTEPASAELDRDPHCVALGCPQQVAWIVTDPRGGHQPCCETDLDEIISIALCRIPLHSTARVEIYRT
jgi:hypothetical protein